MFATDYFFYFKLKITRTFNKALYNIYSNLALYWLYFFYLVA